MGVEVALRDAAGRLVRGLVDPSGGTFDAAGDFERLISDAPNSTVLSSIDLYGAITLASVAAAALLRELPAVVFFAEEGPERRGLLRLTVLAQRCASDKTMTLEFLGD